MHVEDEVLVQEHVLEAHAALPEKGGLVDLGGDIAEVRLTLDVYDARVPCGGIVAREWLHGDVVAVLQAVIGREIFLDTTEHDDLRVALDDFGIDLLEDVRIERVVRIDEPDVATTGRIHAGVARGGSAFVARVRDDPDPGIRSCVALRDDGTCIPRGIVDDDELPVFEGLALDGDDGRVEKRLGVVHGHDYGEARHGCGCLLACGVVVAVQGVVHLRVCDLADASAVIAGHQGTIID